MARARLADVAALAGVSVKTVSNVVNAHPQVHADTRSRVQDAIDHLGYRPHAVGRQLRRGRTDVVALAVPEVDSPYFAELARHVVDAASARSLSVVVEQTGGSLAAERALVDARESGLVDGLVLSPVATGAAELERRASEVPMVLLGEGARPAGVDHVGTDDVLAAQEATAHLLGTGRRQVALLVDPSAAAPLATSRWRREGWARAHAAAGLPVPDHLVLPVGAFTYADGAAGVARALRPGGRPAFDGLVCANDVLALGALRALDDAGVGVPDDVGVVGWDGVSFGAYTTPPLTTVAPDLRQIAGAALALLADRIEGTCPPDAPGRRVVAGHRLVVRASSAPPR